MTPTLFAAVPSALSELAAWIGVATVIIGGGVAIFTRRPFKWLWKRLASEPFSAWTQRQIDQGTKQLREDVDMIRRVTTHHLGKNGDSPRLTDRVGDLEVAHGLEPRPAPPESEGRDG